MGISSPKAPVLACTKKPPAEGIECLFYFIYHLFFPPSLRFNAVQKDAKPGRVVPGPAATKSGLHDYYLLWHITNVTGQGRLIGHHPQSPFFYSYK